MTGQTIGRVGAGVVADGDHQAGVAVEAGLLSNLAIEGSNADGFGKVTQSEGHIVVPAVEALDEILV